MSPSKVKKHIRAQKRLRRQQEKQQRKLAAAEARGTPTTAPESDPAAQGPDVQKTDSQKPGSQEPGAEKPRAQQRGVQESGTQETAAQEQGAEQTAQTRAGQTRAGKKRTRAKVPASRPARRRAGSGTRAAAVVVGIGLLAAGAGSAAQELTDPRHSLAGAHQQAQLVPGPEVTAPLVCPPVPGQPDALTDDGVLDYASRDDSVQTQHSALAVPALDSLTAVTDDEQIGDADRGDQVSLVQSDTARFDYLADSGPVSGMGSTVCAPAQRTHWFLGPEVDGGAVGTGAISLLTLANPHSRPATVRVSSYDAEGDRGSLGETTLLVPAESVRTVNLASIAEAQTPMAVQVESTQATVAASLQSTAAAGSTGLGVELLPAQHTARTEHIMPGIPMPGPEGDASAAEVWVYAAGGEPVTAELQVFGEEGQVTLETAGVFTVEGGQLTVVEVDGIEAAGTYDVQLTTSGPSVAAVRSNGDGEQVTVEVEAEPEIDPLTGLELEPETTEEQEDPAPDFSWLAGAQPLDYASGAILPAYGDSALRLFLPSGAPATQISYRLVDDTGALTDELTVELEPGTGHTLTTEDLEAAAAEADLENLHAVVVTDPGGEVVGSLLAAGELGHFTLASLAPLQQETGEVSLQLQR